MIELEGIDKHRIGYSKTMSKVLFGTLDAKNQVDVPLGITPHMREIFEKYPLDQPIYFSLLMEKAHLAEAAQIHPTQDKPNPSTTIPSQHLADSEPSASGSQKSEVTKKKMKNKEPLVTINECLDETVQSEETKSTLSRLLPRKKKQKTKIGNLSSLSQQGGEIIKGANLLLEAFSQQNVSIEKNLLPNAPCKESAPLQGHSLEGERRQLEAHTMSGEHISFETPLSSQGELPKIHSTTTTLSESTNLNIYLATEDHTSGSQDLQHQDILLDVPTSSDTLHDTMLTTQDLHQDVEGLHVGADPDDNTTNLRVPEVLISALETSTSKSIIHNAEE